MDYSETIMFREVTGQLPCFPNDCHGQLDGKDLIGPPIYAIGRWFYVELHRNNSGYLGPVGLGVVHVTRETREMESLFIQDGERGCGYGRQIIEAAGKRWPSLTWRDTEDSKPFHQHLVEQGVAECVYACSGRGNSRYKFKKQRAVAVVKQAKNPQTCRICG